MTKKTFVRGAVVLGAAGIFVKFMGFIFRIPLVNLIKSDAMALYNPAYYIYILFVTLATSGIPVAVSRMVSERVTVDNYGEAYRVFRLSMNLMLAIGTVSFAIVFFGADIIATWMKIPGSALPMRAIAPCLIIIPVLAAFRGLFQGMQNMRPTAISQIVEQLFRVIVGLSLAYLLFSLTGDGFLSGFSKFERGAAGAAFGGTAGAIGGVGMIVLIYYLNRKNFKYKIKHGRRDGRESNKTLYKKILAISIPITVGASIMPLVNMVDASLIVRRLMSTGMTEETANQLYGGLTGMVNSMINFPQVITLAVAMSLVPLIAAAYKDRDYKFAEENIQLSMRFSMLVGMPCAVGFFTLAEPILLTLFPGDAIVASKTASSFAIMAVAVIFLAAVQTLTGVLQGVGKQMIPVRNMFIGVFVKILCTWFLVPIPSMGVKGAAVGTVLAYLIAAILDVLAVIKYTNVKFNWMMAIVRPFIAAAGMGVCVVFVYKVLFYFSGKNSIATLAAIAAGVIVYVIMIFLTKAIDKEDLLKFPKGDKLLKIVNKFVK